MRAQVMFSLATAIERRVRAPTVFAKGRRKQAAWWGDNVFDGNVVRQVANRVARRHSRCSTALVSGSL